MENNKVLSNQIVNNNTKQEEIEEYLNKIHNMTAYDEINDTNFFDNDCYLCSLTSAEEHSHLTAIIDTFPYTPIVN